MIPFNPSLPNITKSQPVRAFGVGQYLALLLENPKSLAETGGIGAGLITYLYALAIITTTKPADLVFMVTSELSGEELRRIIKERTGRDQTTDPFLCVFDEKGEHHTVGPSPNWAKQDLFVTKALEVVREHFNVAAVPVELKAGGGLAEVEVLGPTGPEKLLPPTIDPQLLDETAATVAGALGVLDDLPEELANTVVNCYYRFLRFAKTRNPSLRPQSGAKRESALELFEQYSRHSSEAIADAKFIDMHIKAIREIQPTTDRLNSIRGVMVQVTLDTFKYHIDGANKKNGIRRAIERKLKKPDEIEELYRFARPLIADHAAENASTKQ